MTVFPLVKPFRPAQWRRVVGELDGVAGQLAKRLSGRIDSSATVTIAGVRGRRYELSYAREGTPLRQRISFLLRGRTEFQLLCRWRQAVEEPEACGLLEETFKPSP